MLPYRSLSTRSPNSDARLRILLWLCVFAFSRMITLVDYRVEAEQPPKFEVFILPNDILNDLLSHCENTIEVGLKPPCDVAY